MGHLTRQTADIIDRSMDFDNNVLYAILHEPIYCQGKASNWSADRTMKYYPEFDLDAAMSSDDETRPVYFTGEMVSPMCTKCRNVVDHDFHRSSLGCWTITLLSGP